MTAAQTLFIPPPHFAVSIETHLLHLHLPLVHERLRLLLLLLLLMLLLLMRHPA